MKTYLKTMLLSAAAAFVFSSCVDKDYDLNNGITSEGTLLENLAAPIGNIEKITLDKLLFSESGSDNGISYNQDGDLYLDFAGSRSYMTVGVHDFYLGSLYLDTQNVEFDIPDNIEGLPSQEIDMTLKYSDVTGEELSLDVDLEIETELPDGIKSVSEVYLDSSLDCNLSVWGGIMYVSKGFEFVFPDFISVSLKSSSNVYVVEGQKVKFVKDAILSEDSPIEISLSLDSISVSEDDFYTDRYGRRMIGIDGSVHVNGDFYIKTEDYQYVPYDMNLIINVECAEMSVTEVLASLEFDSEIDGADMYIDRLPDLFHGNDVCVDLYNPVISLDVDNGSPFDFSLDADISAYTDTKVKEVHIGSYGEQNDSYVYIPASSSKEYLISRRAMTTLPQESVNVVVPELGNLIKEIPHRISIHDVNVKIADGMTRIKTGRQYEVGMEYSFSSPLSFGKDLHLAFTQDLNLNLSLGVDIKSAELEMEIVSTIPVDFEISAECPYDRGMKVSVDKAIASGSIDSPVTTPVVLRIENEDGNFNVSTLSLTLNAESVNPEFHGVCLNRNQGLEINDIVLRLPDGIGVKLNR